MDSRGSRPPNRLEAKTMTMTITITMTITLTMHACSRVPLLQAALLHRAQLAHVGIRLGLRHKAAKGLTVSGRRPSCVLDRPNCISMRALDCFRKRFDLWTACEPSATKKGRENEPA